MLRPPVYDMDLVREKVTRVAYRAELRLAVFAPSTTRQPSRPSWTAWLPRIGATTWPPANGFVARLTSKRSPARTCARPIWLGSRRQAKPILTTRELAGLWHLPHAAADVALLERTTARRWLPMPLSVAEGCRIGVSGHQGRQVPVALPTDVLGRHLLLVAKTRRGKSTLMLRLAQHAMQSEPRRAVLLVDPHRDLAEAALGLVPPERDADVVFLDVADHGAAVRPQPAGYGTGVGPR